MSRSTSRQAGLVALVAFLVVARPAPAQVAVVTARSAEAFLADFRYLAPFFDARAARDLDTFLKETTGGKSLGGVDGKRPLGLYVNWPDKITDLESLEFPVVAFIPVEDEKTVLATLDRLKLKPRAVAGGHRLTLPGETDCYLRFANRHAYLSTRAAVLTEKLPEPSTLVRADGQKSALAARLFTDRIPRKGLGELLDLLLKPLAGELGQLLGDDKQRPGESDERYKERLANLKRLREFPELLRTAVVGLVDTMLAFTVDVDIDAKRNRLALDIALVPQTGGALEEFCRYAARARSAFGPVARDAPFSLLAHFPPPEKAGQETVPDRLPEGVTEILPPAFRDTALKFVQVLIPTIANDGLDVCVLARPRGDELDFIAGLKVRKGRTFDHLLRDAYKNLPAAEKKALSVRLNHDRHGEARIHSFRPEGETEDYYLGIREDVVLLTSGKHGVPALKETLDAFGKGKVGPTPLVQMKMTGALLMADPDTRKAVEKALSKEARGQLEARLSLEGGKDLRLRLDFSTHFLTLLTAFFSEEGDRKP